MFSAGIISYSSENYTFHFKALAEDSVITPKYTNSGWTLEYSADKSTRTSISSWSSFTIPAWETRYMRGSGFSTNSLFASVLSTNARTISKPVECHWNINELINYINPPTTLADYCYASMFEWCTSLTTAPSLPATTMATYCYYGMFRNCTSFKVSATLTWSYDESWRIPTSWTGSVAANWNLTMLTWTWWTYTSSPSINTTYYIENPPV